MLLCAPAEVRVKQQPRDMWWEDHSGPEEAAGPEQCARMGEVARECVVSPRVLAGEQVPGGTWSPKFQWTSVRPRSLALDAACSPEGPAVRPACCLSDLGLPSTSGPQVPRSAGRAPTGVLST